MDETRRNRDFSKGPVWDTQKSRWFVEIRYPDGSRLRKRFRREREALRAWSGEQTKLENGTWNVRTPKAVTFGAAIERYKAHAKVHVPSYASYTEPALKVWEAGIPADTPLTRVTPGDDRCVEAEARRGREEMQRRSQPPGPSATLLQLEHRTRPRRREPHATGRSFPGGDEAPPLLDGG